MIIDKNLKAWVRYDATGRVVEGGPILQHTKPKSGKWKEIPAYLCCNTPSPSEGYLLLENSTSENNFLLQENEGLIVI